MQKVIRENIPLKIMPDLLDLRLLDIPILFPHDLLVMHLQNLPELILRHKLPL